MFDMQPIKKEINIHGFNSIYYFEMGKTFTHEPESHDFWEMVYVDNGSIYAITDGVGISLKQGQAIFHKPNELHAHISDKKSPNNMLVVAFTAEGEAMDYFKGKTFTLDKTSKILLSLFLEEAKNALTSVPGNYNNKENLDFSKSSFGAVQLLECHFTEFLIKIMDEYMKKNVRGNLTLKELCTAFSMGKTKICSIFGEWAGKSPMEYYQDLKISEAKKLLRENTYSVSQISEILGYTTIHNFSRAFKKAAGLSPTAYIKSIIS